MSAALDYLGSLLECRIRFCIAMCKAQLACQKSKLENHSTRLHRISWDGSCAADCKAYRVQACQMCVLPAQMFTGVQWLISSYGRGPQTSRALRVGQKS